MFTLVHADLCNFYYQVGVGARLAKRMLLLWGKDFLQAKVMCMGFQKACGVAMAIVISLLLKTELHEPDLGVPDEYDRSDVAPGCVHLRNGGLIFLVYDSILIICPSKDAVHWEKRLQNRFALAGLVFKYCAVAKSGEIVPYCGMESRVI